MNEWSKYGTHSSYPGKSNTGNCSTQHVSQNWWIRASSRVVSKETGVVPVSVCAQNNRFNVPKDFRPFLTLFRGLVWNLNMRNYLQSKRSHQIIHESGTNIRHRFSVSYSFPVISNEVYHLRTMLSKGVGVHLLQQSPLLYLLKNKHEWNDF